MSYEVFKKEAFKLLKDEKLQLPQRVNKNYYNSVNHLLDYYCDQLKFMNKNSHNEIVKICDYLKKMCCNDLDYCLQIFEEMITHTVLMERINIIRDKLPVDGFGKSNANLFRVREISDNVIYEREDMFHLPESLRENQRVYRYNIQGKPSLYLNSTIYGCCNELNKNAGDKLIGSMFRLSKEVECKDKLFIFDMGVRPIDFIQHKSKRMMSYSYGNYLYVYPLIAVCSFIAPNKGKSAPDVYCITNTLLKWISLNYGDMLCGIRYFSCTHEEYKISDSKGLKKESTSNSSFTKYHMNYVFPIEQGKLNYQFSPKLANAFLVSKPRHISDCLDIKDFETTIKSRDIKTLKKIKNYK